MWPTADGIHLPLVHLHSIFGDNVFEEVVGVAVELTIFQLEVEMEFPQFMEDLFHMVVMFGQVPGVNDYVVDVDDDEMMEELLEHLFHKGLEYGG